jgi:hypothetical protein
MCLFKISRLKVEKNPRIDKEKQNKMNIEQIDAISVLKLFVLAKRFTNISIFSFLDEQVPGRVEFQ